LHEQGLWGSLEELARLPDAWRGEIVVVVGPRPAAERDDAEQRELVEACLKAAVESGTSPTHLARRLSEVSGLPRRELYERALLLIGEAEASGALETSERRR
jgi:16S rRNA C1402 (ribose-2'-O) methylase RsmI